MNLIRKFRDGFSERLPRENLVKELESSSITAQVAERGRLEEKIGTHQSLGVIDISNSVIRWINVVSNENCTWAEYAVPDQYMGISYPKVSLRIKEIKNMPIFGAVIAHRWVGDDKGLNLVDRQASELAGFPEVTGSVRYVRSHPELGCWIIGGNLSGSHDAWVNRVSMAAHLLRSSVGIGQSGDHSVEMELTSIKDGRRGTGLETVSNTGTFRFAIVANTKWSVRVLRRTPTGWKGLAAYRGCGESGSYGPFTMDNEWGFAWESDGDGFQLRLLAILGIPGKHIIGS